MPRRSSPVELEILHAIELAASGEIAWPDSVAWQIHVKECNKPQLAKHFRYVEGVHRRVASAALVVNTCIAGDVTLDIEQRRHKLQELADALSDSATVTRSISSEQDLADLGQRCFPRSNNVVIVHWGDEDSDLARAAQRHLLTMQIESKLVARNVAR